MKTNAIRSTRYTSYRRDPCMPYPGVTAPRRFWEKLLDAALAASITIGAIVILMFLVIL